jgi:PPK2 family polyphosphate:nucleotide phosphotransferase
MIEPTPSPYLVPFDGSFRVEAAPTAPPDDAPPGRERRRELRKTAEALGELQRKLYAQDRHAVLAIFQAIDAAGKDGTIRAVFSGINPTGCQVSSFKRPSAVELDHDFLWRSTARLPERGHVGVFNRSYYEEVLVVRVHPELLDAQRLPEGARTERIWEERFASIRDHERHLARSGTLLVKLWLNVSSEVQRGRLLSRIHRPEKHWKFSAGDVAERAHWGAYMRAYEEAMNATSRPWAPWYAIPADDKPFMRLTVARILLESIQRLDPDFPSVGPERVAELERMRVVLESEG